MLLIRSQDRGMLVPLNRPVYAYNQEIYYRDEQAESDGILLGKYSSSPRCLEILDEIQKIFQYDISSCDNGIAAFEEKKSDYGVYQMPEK